jgi:hypothetical protein
MFGALDREAQRELTERVAIPPRHIHAMAQKVLIVVSFPARSPIVNGD